ncbi:PAS domain S-box-containing protein [Anaerovirgula multivorans]|uniref:PAS domain S-box-containing protein n=1 Tax=Anaerovirgula multivorans TaxID=312168 RepID=A0A239CZW8_9FIRM|nr:sigma 54-interacting transcriptional regulator [Anaerovirgula multivorans]SNS25499.1 PAS domain S-box-containing protein [Anaerovirgula multivorans]
MEIDNRVMQYVLNHSINGILIFNNNFNIAFSNKAAQKIFEYNEMLTGKCLSEFIPQDNLNKIRQNNTERFYKIKLKTKVIAFDVIPIFEKNIIEGYAAVFQDVSKYESIVEEMDKFKELNRRLEAIIDSSYDGIYVTDGEANTILLNKAYEHITGIRGKDILGKNMMELVKQGYFSQSGSLLAIEKDRQVTLRQRLVSGKEILITSTPVYNTNKKREFIVTNVRDISDLVKLQEKLSETKALNEKYKSELENIKEQTIEIPELIVKDKNTIQTVRTALKVARVDTTVLLMGETGVGKGQFAKLIHKNSTRLHNRLVEINCGAIPRNLIESELFGYDRGAFTGALQKGKMGVFELANNSTLFLDEISELDIDMQVKLLKVLEEKIVKRIGGEESIPINVRIIAACNQDLKKMVEKGLFREDLYYRLNIIPVVIPPLRERREDIIPLCLSFLDEFNSKYRMNKYITVSVLDSFMEYSWPGNVRELRNLIERLVIMSQNDKIDKSLLPQYILGKNHTEKEMEKEIKEEIQENSIDEYVGMNLKDATIRFQQKLINQTIDRLGSQRKAAKYLEVDPSTVSRKLNE